MWDDGLWERRAHVAHDPRKRSDPEVGPRGQAPIGPRELPRQMAGVWEARAQHHREDVNGHVPRDVGELGHVRRDANRHDGRWEGRADWGRDGACPKMERESGIHEVGARDGPLPFPPSPLRSLFCSRATLETPSLFTLHPAQHEVS